MAMCEWCLQEMKTADGCSLTRCINSDDFSLPFKSEGG